MIHPDRDPRYKTAEGCMKLAKEFQRLERSAQLLVKRHAGWKAALVERAERIEKAERLEAEALAERFRADRLANQLASEVVDIFDLLRPFAKRRG